MIVNKTSDLSLSHGNRHGNSLSLTTNTHKHCLSHLPLFRQILHPSSVFYSLGLFVFQSSLWPQITVRHTVSSHSVGLGDDVGITLVTKTDDKAKRNHAAWASSFCYCWHTHTINMHYSHRRHPSVPCSCWVRSSLIMWVKEEVCFSVQLSHGEAWIYACWVCMKICNCSVNVIAQWK